MRNDRTFLDDSRDLGVVRQSGMARNERELTQTRLGASSIRVPADRFAFKHFDQIGVGASKPRFCGIPCTYHPTTRILRRVNHCSR